MARPTTRQELIDYCKRALGSPVIDINVDTTQAEDRIDEALSMYREFHSDAIFRSYLKHQITAQDITNEYVSVDAGLTEVVRVLPMGASSSGSGSGMFSAQYQFSLNDMYLLNGYRSGMGGGLSYYYQTKSYMSLLDGMLNGKPHVRYKRHADELYIDVDWDVDIKEGDWIIVEGYTIVDEATNVQVYDDLWLKQYATQLIKRQWGANLKKFEGMQLPGAVTFSGQQLFDEATGEILRLEEELRLNWEDPCDFFTG